MCGICLFICDGCQSPAECISYNEFVAAQLAALKRRGPDAYSSTVVTAGPRCALHLSGSVLWTQGRSVVTQPLLGVGGEALLWNGDIFGGKLAKHSCRSDTEVLLAELSRGSFLDVVSGVKGPYSVVYWDPRAERLWFGRDRLGRHSLLVWCAPGGNGIRAIVSVAMKSLHGVAEVPAVGIFCAKLDSAGEFGSVCLFPWSDITEDQLSSFKEEFAVKCTVSSLRIQSPLTVPLFTSTVTSEPAEGDLLAVVLAGMGLSPVQVMERLLQDEVVAARVDRFIRVLSEAVSARVSVQPDLCKLCSAGRASGGQEPSPKNRRACEHAKTAVLFSGGLDSAVLARLAHDFVPSDDPIDLLNVAFEKPSPPGGQCRWQRREGKREAAATFDVPDRKTGRDTLRELEMCFPKRRWNFVEINVGLEELDVERGRTISHLVYPLASVLDDSLGCALWFASRGEGLLYLPQGQSANYTSPARVVLVGMGADEQLGGYMRHRSALGRGGWLALGSELRRDLARISARNLGRDDRVTADHGRQGRFPYLDEDVVSFLADLPPWHRCCPVQILPPGYGDKTLLRLAALKLGLNKAAFLPKRAFQFGSRIANAKEKASDVSHRL